jgi:pyrroline-5-carboxylate reductase
MLAVQTAVGTSKLLDTGITPSRLMEMVTSPGGTTAAGLKIFDEKDLKSTVASAIKAAINRSEELGKTV